MATYNYLDKIGLGQVWEKIKNYINNNFLSKTNTTAYTPTTDYHPATKKYVDDNIEAIPQPDWDAGENEDGYIMNRPTWLHLYDTYIFRSEEPTAFVIPSGGSIEVTPITNYVYSDLHWGGQVTIVTDNGTITSELGYDELDNCCYCDLDSSDFGLRFTKDKVELVSKLDSGDTYNISEIRVPYYGLMVKDEYNSIFQSDWDENDYTSPSYIANRTHWTDDPVITEVWSDTLALNGDTYYELTFDDYAWTNNITKNSTLIVNFNGVTYICSVRSTGYGTYKFGNESLVNDTQDDTNEPFLIEFAPNYADYFLMLSSTNTPTGNINISITTYNSNIHKLDNKYLNGKLITEGFGEDSEIFNGTYGKVAGGMNSHVEGVGDYTQIYTVTISGEANATVYNVTALQSSGARDAYDTYYECTYNGILESEDGNKKSTISVPFNRHEDTTITVNKTLDADNDIVDETYYVMANMTYAADYAHAEGNCSFAGGESSHAENGSIATGMLSHAENTGYARGSYSHAEGFSTTAYSDYSHAEGMNTYASGGCQHVQGKFNVVSSDYADIVGNGTSSSARSNAYTLDWSGNGVYAGKLTIGTAPTNDMDVATKQYVDNATSGITTNLSGLTDTTISSPTNGQFLQYNSTSSKWENKTYSAPVTSVNGQTGAVTISVPTASSTTPSSDGTAAVGVSTTYARADHVHPKITQSLSISANVITLTGSDGTTSSVTLPVYNGGVSS